MKQAAVALAIASAAPAAVAAVLPPMTAQLRHEVHEVGADGVTRTSEYRERFYRQGTRLWIERERPDWALALPGGDVHELNINTASRMIEQGPGEAARLWLVDAAHRVRYAVEPGQRERAAFSGRWDLEAMLIDPRELSQLTHVRTVLASAGVQTFERKAHGEVLRILWNPKLLFPELIETGSADGRSLTRTRVTLLPLPDLWPWEGIKGYAERELSDLDD